MIPSHAVRLAQRLAVVGALAAILLLSAGGVFAQTPAGAPDAPFFNGKDLTGWMGLPGFWRVVDGAIVGAPTGGVKAHTFLCSAHLYGDFELSFKVRRKNGTGNSGIQIRSSWRDRDRFILVGPQIEIESASFAFPPGSLLHEPTARPAFKADPAVIAKVWKNADFNDMHIRCVGKHVTIKIAGEVVVDTDYPSMPNEGIIAWQLHGSRPPEEITFKDIQFKELTPRRPMSDVVAGGGGSEQERMQKAAAKIFGAALAHAIARKAAEDPNADAATLVVVVVALTARDAAIGGALRDLFPRLTPRQSQDIRNLIVAAVDGQLDFGDRDQKAAKARLIGDLRRIDPDLADAAVVADFIYAIHQLSRRR